MDSAPQDPTLARRLETDPTTTWDVFRDGLGDIAKREAPQLLGDDDESRIERIALAVADTATFNAAPLSFDKEAWRKFVETDHDGNRIFSEEETNAIFKIAKLAGVITSWEVVRPSGTRTICAIPSTVIQQRLEGFLRNIP